MAQSPHCDQDVLHAPGECEFCDMHADLQQARIDGKINFTNHFDKDKAPCPSWVKRGQSASVWGGNRPYKSHPCKKCGRKTEIERDECLACELDRYRDKGR